MTYRPIVLPGLAAGLLAAALTACVGSHPEEQFTGERNMWVGAAIQGASLDRAIVVQRTLYPYHFEENSASLNELGRRDLLVLSRHFSAEKGDLNLRRGSASKALYEGRVKNVQDQLLADGVSKDRIKIGDSMPGGDGISSERILVILAKPPFDPNAGSTTTIGMSGSAASAATTTTTGGQE